MNAEQKAQELITKFYSITLNEDVAKQCALIAVDEMIEEIKLMFPEPYKQQWKYWEQVKNELIKF
jgi:hypothetical protein